MEALIFPALLFLVMYFALIRPQQRTAKEARQLMASLAVGDEVVTTSGIHGFINSLEENIVWLEVAGDVELKMSRSAISGRIVEGDPTDENERHHDEDDDDDEEDQAAGLGDTDVID